MTLPADPQQRLAVIGAEIADRVERVLPGWFVARVGALADAWGRCAPDVRAALDAATVAAAPGVAAQVGAELRAFFARPAGEQVATPLQIVRGAVAAATGLLADAGVPAVERDAFAEQAFPDDAYDLVPASLADLGDDDLGALQLAWGIAKVNVLRPAADA